MTAMMKYNPVAVSLFTISWTIGMAAMMFPAITPMVLLYNKLIKRSNNNSSNDGNPSGVVNAIDIAGTNELSNPF